MTSRRIAECVLMGLHFQVVDCFYPQGRSRKLAEVLDDDGRTVADGWLDDVESIDFYRSADARTPSSDLVHGALQDYIRQERWHA